MSRNIRIKQQGLCVTEGNHAGSVWEGGHSGLGEVIDEVSNVSLYKQFKFYLVCKFTLALTCFAAGQPMSSDCFIF